VLVTVSDVPKRRAADRCPGVMRPHAAQDGLLVRVRLIGGRISPDGLTAIARAVQAGNGIVELTGRANVQVRGMAAEDLEPLAARFLEAALLRTPTHDRARNVVADPLAGRRAGALAGASAIDAVLDGLDDGICSDPALAQLPGRFLFCVDDGSGATAGVDADVRVVAGAGGAWAVVVGDRALATGDGSDAVAVALDVARAFLACLGDARAWRIVELPGGAARVLAELGPTDGVPRCATAGAAPIVGTLPQRDGRVAVGALAPLGRIPRGALDLLAGIASTAEVRVSHRRSVAVLDVDTGDAPALARTLAAAGLIVHPGSGWEGLTACAGAGACASALADVRAGAGARATERASAGPHPREHWSACPRRCGQTADVARAVSALPGGAWDITELTR